MSNLFAIPADLNAAAIIGVIQAVADYQDRQAPHAPAPDPRPISPGRLTEYQRSFWHSLVAKGWREEDATRYVRKML